MSKNKNVMIKTVANSPLLLCESATNVGNNKYRFRGVFTACSDEKHTVINRNNRIYPLEEMMRHLGYLREMVKNNQLMGELDHPTDRFETSLKECCLKVTDLWLDKETACICGEAVVLDTPNGNILKVLLENGMPFSVSSRASGTVDEKTKFVKIQQIWAYDAILIPGFAEAVLQRVDESLTTEAR